jgi:formylglycine-generating enzyme required for sulfatase activity
VPPNSTSRIDMSSEFNWLLSAYDSMGDPDSLCSLAQELLIKGTLGMAATAYDRAYSLAPNNKGIVQARKQLLDQLAVLEYGLKFRYIPAGTFLMGSEGGDPDEKPTHPVELGEFWLSETPVSWSALCDLMDWEPPPFGRPKGSGTHMQGGGPTGNLLEANKIRLQYCEDATSHAWDWHAHVVPASEERPDFTIDWNLREELQELAISEKLRHAFEEQGYQIPQAAKILERTNWFPGWEIREDKSIYTYFHIVEERDELAVYVGGVASRYLHGNPPREDPRRPWLYDRKPMVSVSWQEAEELCQRLSNEKVLVRLPTEAEWEKAARGGLIGCRYPWGNELPDETRCDFNRFDQFSILPMRRFQPNDYGLYGMSGCVWEWTSDWYDARHYENGSLKNPHGPENGVEKVLRGGSWTDCAEAVTVSFRMSRQANTWREGHWGGHFVPNIGFRLCRVERQLAGTIRS